MELRASARGRNASGQPGRLGWERLEGWFSGLWDALTAVDPEYVLAGLGLQTLETLLSAFAWLAIVRAAYPNAGIETLPIITAYAVAVAGNDVLPASLGTLVMLVMLTAIIPAVGLRNRELRPCGVGDLRGAS